MNYKTFFFMALIFTAVFLGGIFVKNMFTDKKLPNRPTIIPRTSPLIVKVSIPYWDQERATEHFRENVENIDVVNMFWYFITDDGKVNTYEYATEDEETIAFAKENGVQVFATITNLPETTGDSWDSERVEAVLKNKKTRQNHIKNISDKLDEMGFDGVLVDYENVDKSERENFSLFINELANELHRDNKKIAISLHPKSSDVTNGLGDFQDWEELGKYADALHIMAFNEHWDTSSAGPIASIDWVIKMITYAQSLDVESQKFYLGIPMFAYAWNKDNDESADGLEYDEVAEIMDDYEITAKWDEEALSPYFIYENDEEETIEVWFENADSSSAKIAITETSGFGGISVWRIGGEDPNFWTLLKKVRASN